MRPEQIAQPFSLPCAAPEALFDTVICADGLTRVRLFLERNGAAITASSPGLTAYVEDWLRQPVSTAMARSIWDLAFGQVGLALKDRRIDAVEAAVRMALRLAESGHPGRWAAAMAPTPLVFGGFLVEGVEAVEADVSAAGMAAVVLVPAKGSPVAVVGVPGDWSSRNAEALPGMGELARALLVPKGALPRNPACSFFGECGAVSAVDEAAERTFRGSFQALGEAAPDYLAWVDRVLNGVVVTGLHPGYRVVSGSWQEAPGYLHASHPHRPLEIAEILVHECAHQYFYMLERLGPFDDGSDDALYWSPVAGVKRPLARVLMAYHAMANVLRLYRRVEAAGLDDGYVAANMANLLEIVRQLAEPLRDNPALTPLGRGLFEPLARQTDA